MEDTETNKSKKILPFGFNGFSLPTTTAIPDQVLDLLMPFLSGAELKVLLYICRRTFGWRKSHDNISLQQMVEGITKEDGRVLDQGTGLSKATVARALNGLEAENIIVRNRRSSARKGDQPTTFAIKMIDPVSQNETPPVSRVRHPLSHGRDTQQTNIQQTDLIQQQRKMLMDLGFKPRSINRLLKLYPQERIREKLDYLQFLQTEKPGKLTHPRGWLSKAIEEDYEAPKGYRSAAERNHDDRKKEEKRLHTTKQHSKQSQEKAKALQQQRSHTQRILSALKDKSGTSPDEKRLWQQIVTDLQEDVGLTGTKLLDQTNLLGTQNGKATITAENSFSAQWIERRFSDQIHALLKDNGRPVDKIQFVVLSDIGETKS